jgi:hypothetical protein
MHQMRISTAKVSSVVLRPKKLEIRKKNCENCMRRKKTNTSDLHHFQMAYEMAQYV